MNRRIASALLPILLGSIAMAPLRGQGDAQDPRQEVERLRRDQDEILRKAGRLRDLMDRLLQRCQREGKTEQVELLQQGLAHLERASLLKDVASIRDDLAGGALSEALRKQQEVVDDIERLLNILLQRRSIDNLEQEIQQTTELAGRIRELERRQADLQAATKRAAETEATPAEQQLQQQLQQLQKDQASEAQRNARDAGSRRPFLENALQQVKDLQQRQGQLEQRAEAERTGKATADRERAFDLGDLLERSRNLASDVRSQTQKQDLAKAAARLDQAIQDGDPSGMQQAKDELEALLQHAPNRPDKPITPPMQAAGLDRDDDWKQLREQVQKAPAGGTAAEKEQLAQLADAARKVADQREQVAREDNGATAQQLAAAARELQQKLQQDAGAAAAADPKQAEQSPAAATEQAAKALDEAGRSAQQGDAKKALEQTLEAMRQFDEARRRLREQNPDAQQLANSMAAKADATERELRNAPRAEDAEQKAADALDRAEQALRQTGEQIDRQAADGRREATTAEQQQQQQTLEQSRQNLDAARKELEQALQEAGADRQADMQAAAERQQALQQRAKQAAQQMQQARQSGALNQAQQQQAQEQMDRAEQAMQQAQQALQQGEQSTASRQQQQAAQALQQAQQALEKNRTPGAQQQQAMQELSAEQQKLEEEILRLAEEAKQRKNAEARRALEEAGEAARKARQGMQQGDQDEAEQQQQRAREKLDEAAKQLEEERDRYLDQRQEELLFKMKEELLSFLEKQQPMTVETEAMQKAAAAEGLSRAARLKLNTFAKEEQALAVRLDTLIAALTEEGNVVYRTVLGLNRDDLQEIARRLSGRNPDASQYTTMLQHDVEMRTKDMLDALAREQQRRDEERQQEQQQQQQGENKFSPQRQKLVSLIADLEALKKLEENTRQSSDDLRKLIELRSGDGVTAAELALVERLTHRHAEVTKLFQQIKAGVEQTMQSMQGQDEDQEGNGHRGR